MVDKTAGLLVQPAEDDQSVVMMGFGPLQATPNDVLQLLDQEGYGDLCALESEIARFCQELAGAQGPVSAVVAERRDAQVQIEVSPDRMAAFLTLHPPEGGRTTSKKQILAALESMGVVVGVKTEEVERAARLLAVDHMLVAEGIAPRPASSGRWNLLLEGDRPAVNCGTACFQIIGPSQGEAGVTVTGETLLPPLASSQAYELVEGLERQGDDIVATVDGWLEIQGRDARVIPSSQVSVEVDHDKLAAYVSVSPAKRGRPPSLAYVQRAIKDAGVVAGIIPEALEQLTQLFAITRFLVAQAQYPVNGQNSSFQRLARNKDERFWVDKGTPLLRRVPPTPGKPGLTVTGETMPPGRDGKLTPFGPCYGTEPSSDDPDTLVAAVSGLATYGDNWVQVEASCQISITIAPDGLYAYLDLRGGREPQFTETLIRQALEEKRVIAGILDEAVRDAARRGEAAHLMVAQGSRPQPGTAGSFSVLVPQGTRLVEKGTPLMRRVPPTPGTPGVTVQGDRLNAPPQPELAPFAPSPGTESLPGDPNTLRAAVSGRLHLMERGARVEEVERVKIVTPDNGVTRFEGGVVIEGQVTPGSHLVAAGDVVVIGSVSDAVIEADGSVEVDGGIVGTSQVQAKGSVRARYIRGGKVDSGGEVRAEEGIHHANVNAVGAVTVGPNAAIVGGTVRSVAGVQAPVIGDPGGTPTTLEVGAGPHWQLRLNKIKFDIANENQRLAELEKGIQHLRSTGRWQFHPRTLELLEHQKKQVVDVRQRLEGESADLTEIIGRRPGRVAASEYFYPGVKIHLIDLARSLHVVHDVDQPLGGGIFGLP